MFSLRSNRYGILRLHIRKDQPVGPSWKCRIAAPRLAELRLRGIRRLRSPANDNVPTANWLLMIGTLLIVVLFKTSQNLAGAYGIAISGTMLVTTILLYRVAIGSWRWPPAVAIFIIMVFGAIDATFVASNSLKVVEGGWFPITLGAAMAGLMLCWRQGSSIVRHRLQDMSMSLESFVDNIDKMVVARPPGVGVWLTKVAHGASPMLLHHVKNNSVLHETVILMTFVADRRPRVPLGERHLIEGLGHGIYRIQVRP